MEAQGLRERLRTVEESHHRDVGGMEDRLAEMQLQLDEVGGGKASGIEGGGKEGGRKGVEEEDEGIHIVVVTDVYIFLSC